MVNYNYGELLSNFIVDFTTFEDAVAAADTLQISNADH